MFAQAAGLAVLAALTPAALLLVTVYLGSANPRRALAFYLSGAVLMTVVAGVIVLIALRAGGLSVPSNRQPRYGLRLGLGVLALGAGIFLARRRPRERKAKAKAKAKKPGIISRWAANPRPVTAFASGVVSFAPSLGFIAAVQVIATSRASDAVQAGALALVVVIDLFLVWLPFVVYLAAPERTVRTLKASNAWISTNRRILLAGGLAILGAILVADGISGLV